MHSKVWVSLVQTLTVLHLISRCTWVKQEKDRLCPPGCSPAHHLLHYTSQFRGHLEQQGPTKGRRPRHMVHKYHSHAQCV